ncbi:MAG: SpoVR family protein [Candidatus Yanofskybacteria bacterium RIFCSPHIGHO2_01_FULL_45_42]|uniref:SpoVR family protein n=3 Tax=Candidatus Yanofskyibacteriota TaxID=1752733 RepID=A0A1F8F2C5_9BACT|nr:MAG: SpoVR family protein [Candidatus Yanofskybacteria bacterium RIFCSPHIGHO2_01_FULL_45_42]OGN16456.1 MAG: SpoVR family protein [Candidatus Yanofskybacteria bacterium RIFCSPHIGHO2_02_FULL_46_19]OGN27355.1 MAG: SpoVR family protein [Candidatus Yanofskybacteria bacterium RIFCSPLOWO2_01_FULL_45_72]OGN31676.1 MAG: SpoVR family protein [Candidatus Yanofskybacteria bacterium RIFCSPLOWO2_02_FULL_45_18]
MNLTPELEQVRDEIKGYAIEYGLDPFETIFEVLDFEQMNEVASFGGFPTRYPHWTFGMEYDHLKKSYAYGLHKIYEMVINNDPSYAYLLKNNALVDQKIVIAHVYGHTDFFRNNYWFSATPRKMMDGMANHATLIRQYIDKYGFEEVEKFLDICLSIDDLVDFHSCFIKRPQTVSKTADIHKKEEDEESEKEKIQPTRFPAKDYMSGFVNKEEALKEEEARLKKEEEQKKYKFPLNPEKDILMFLIDNAPIGNWQKVILSIIRDEAYYFAPQRATKIMNEGWAVYWHSTIMTEKAMRDSELVDYADHHSGTLGSMPGTINPYKLGVELYRDVEERWNKGRFGKEYNECDDMQKRKDWDLHLGIGRQKIFHVRRVANDITFIDNFLTKEFCEKHKLFTHKLNEITGMYEISDRDFQAVKQKLLFLLTNFGQPIIRIVNSNYKNRGELYLLHQHEGVDMDIEYAKDTIENIQKIWKRSVHLETRLGDKGKLFTFNGKDHIVLNTNS